MSTHHFDRLFRPRSVAIVGASPRPGSLGRAVLDNLRAGGFEGPIGLVNPHHPTIDGLPCVATLAALSSIPDLVIVVAPKESVVALVEEAAAAGANAAVVITADPDHGELSLVARLREIVRRTGI